MKLWQPNQPLDNGRFVIQKFIARGGYGATYSAIELRTNKLVVIKTLNLELQSKPDFPQQQVKFVNEGLRLAQCSHPNVVKVHELIQEDGLWGMVMEYIDGQDLGRHEKNYNGAPSNGNAWLDNNNHDRLLRGGSWGYIPRYCRSACRFKGFPNFDNDFIGFRVVCGGAART